MDYIEAKSNTLDVLLHGAGGGMKHSNMQKVFERGEEHSSGPELIEEVETLKKILSDCGSEKYKHIRLIGKSLGAIIAAKYLSGLPVEDQKKYSVIIFGYDTGMINIFAFPGKISIIQGEKDKYGNIETVKENLKNAKSKDISYFEVPNADHSYRNEQKEPIYEDIAINYFKTI